MKLKRILLSSVVSIVLSVLLASSASALSLKTSPYKITAAPGETVDLEYVVAPDEGQLGKEMQYTLEVGGFSVLETGALQLLEGSSLETEPASSVSSWITDYDEKLVTSEETGIMKATLSVPTNTAPGTYYLALIFRGVETASLGPDGTGASVQTRIASRVTINIPGEVNEDMNIVTFSVDEAKKKLGAISFNATFENKSSFEFKPQGEITIFDAKGTQVESIVLETKTLPDGSKILVEEQDVLAFNKNRAAVEPLSTKTIKTDWENRSIASGSYTAKLEGSFGANGKFSAQTDIEISEGIDIVSFAAKNYWNKSLPVDLVAIIGNRGNASISPTYKLTVRDLWGNIVYSNESEAVVIGAGEDFEIKNGLTWSEGFAMGTYSAMLEVKDANTGVTATMTAQFLVMTWWQILIVIVVVLLVVFAFYKGISSYVKMKQKIQKLEAKK